MLRISGLHLQRIGRQKVNVSDREGIIPTDLYSAEVKVPPRGFDDAQFELTLPAALEATHQGTMNDFDEGDTVSAITTV